MGYLVGVIVAELTLARVPGEGPRVASLTTRRIADYAPRLLLAAQVAFPLVAMAVAVVTAVDTEPEAVVLADHQRSGALWAAPIVLVVAIGSAFGQRYFVRRPQPSSAPDVLAVDDAMRASSVRLIAATSATLSALIVSVQLAYLGSDAAEYAGHSGALVVASIVMAFVAWLCWWSRLPRSVLAARPKGPRNGPVAQVVEGHP